MKEEASLDYIDQIAGGDSEFHQRFVTILKDEFPGEKAEYEFNMAQKEYRKASETVHKIKHKLNVLSLLEGHKLAARHESELLDEAVELSDEFMAVLNYVESYLKSI